MSRRKSKAIHSEKKGPGELLTESMARFEALLPADEFVQLLEELERPLYPALRSNPLKINPIAALADWSKRYGWQTQPIPYCDSGWWVQHSDVLPSQTIEHRLGFYYIQDAASMLPVELFDFSSIPASLILDLAASPGGKTTHLAAKSGDRGLIIANDSSQGRITALRLVLQTWGAANTAVTAFPGERFGPWFPETFDRVLLDAPCSMQNLRSTESHPLRSITEKEQKSLVTRQTRLLASAFQSLKIGGQVVYSTCTLAPEEDETVVEALIRQFPEAVQVVNVQSRLPVPAPGLVFDGTIQFSPAVQNTVRLWPHKYGTSGFFAALITKLAPVQTTTQTAPDRSFAKTGLIALSRIENRKLVDFFQVSYGFNLPDVLEKQDLSLWQRGTAVFALPDLFLNQFSGLPFQGIGLLVGEWTPDGFAPSHEWVARFGKDFQLNWFILAEELIPAWQRGEDIHQLNSSGRIGTVVVVGDAQRRLLGRGKIQAQRLKNLLPRRLV
jgi:16S rRNA (cytosine1407-C5)-methyltransferase